MNIHQTGNFGIGVVSAGAKVNGRVTIGRDLRSNSNEVLIRFPMNNNQHQMLMSSRHETHLINVDDIVGIQYQETATKAKFTVNTADKFICMEFPVGNKSFPSALKLAKNINKKRTNPALKLEFLD